MTDKPEMKVMDVMGMSFEVWTYRSCTAEFASEDDWATLYGIESMQPSCGHATTLLLAAKKHYEELGKRFGGSVALNERMRSLYKHLGIVEYDDPYDKVESEDKWIRDMAAKEDGCMVNTGSPSITPGGAHGAKRT